MKNYLFSLFKRYFKKEITILTANHYNKGYQDRINSSVEEKRKIELFELEEMIGKKVICISNEWENPIIGIVKEVITITKANNPVAIVIDYLTMKEIMVLGKIYPYTEQRFEAILKLSPFELCSLIYSNFYYNEEFKKDKIGCINTKEEIKKILDNNKFNE